MKVAIVCDWLTNMGGAERVVLELHKMYPDAPIYTSTFEARSMPLFKGMDIRTAWFQKLPRALRRHQLLTLPRQWHFGHMKLKGYDVIISTSGAEAKAVRGVNALHVNYCHSPTQYYWIRPDEYLRQDSAGGASLLWRLGLRLLLPYAKRWDLKAATRPDIMIANSTVVQSRIKKIYGRDSAVIFPPVDTARFTPKEHLTRQGYVIAGRLVHHKRIDLAIAACNELQVSLTVIGEGPEASRLKAMAGPTVKFTGFISDEKIPNYFHKAGGFIFPNEEDFGIVAVEALAAGCPVIAYRAGGALDFVKENITGTFFEKQTTEALTNAITDFKGRHFSSDRIVVEAQNFSTAHFHNTMAAYVEREYHKSRRRTA